METKNQLEKIISISSLEETDKEFWKEFIGGVTENEIRPILESLQDNPENIHFFTKNLQEKFLAIKSGQKEALKKILENEKKFLTKNIG